MRIRYLCGTQGGCLGCWWESTAVSSSGVQTATGSAVQAAFRVGSAPGWLAQADTSSTLLALPKMTGKSLDQLLRCDVESFADSQQSE